MSKFPMVLELLKKSEYSVGELYMETKQKIPDVSEFIEILDCLYILGKIEFDDEKEVLRYAVRDDE